MNLHRENSASWQNEILPLEYLIHERAIVLAGHANQDPRGGEGMYQLLILTMHVAAMIQIPRDLFGANFSEKAFPKRIIQVCNQALLRRAVLY